MKPLKTKLISAPILGEPVGICLLVHGRTGNLQLLQWFSKRFKIPGLDYLLVEAPFKESRNVDEELPHYKNLTGGDLKGFSWFLGREDKEGLETSRKLILDLIDDLVSKGYETKKIYWLGFSQGGVMGLDLFLRAPFLLGGLECISAYCVETEAYPKKLSEFAKDQRLLITHGTRDEIIDFIWSKKTYEKLDQVGVPYELKSYSKRHSFDLRQEIPYLESTLYQWVGASPRP